jgi:hypothetical protein
LFTEGELETGIFKDLDDVLAALQYHLETLLDFAISEDPDTSVDKMRKLNDATVSLIRLSTTAPAIAVTATGIAIPENNTDFFISLLCGLKISPPDFPIAKDFVSIQAKYCKRRTLGLFTAHAVAHVDVASRVYVTALGLMKVRLADVSYANMRVLVRSLGNKDRAERGRFIRILQSKAEGLNMIRDIDQERLGIALTAAYTQLARDIQVEDERPGSRTDGHEFLRLAQESRSVLKLWNRDDMYRSLDAIHMPRRPERPIQ